MLETTRREVDRALRANPGGEGVLEEFDALGSSERASKE
jgi:hypothetical protein